MDNFKSISITAGKPLQINNPTKYKLIGQGKQGAVIKLSSSRCVKIYTKESNALCESEVLKAVKGSPFFPELYEVGKKYIIMEYFKGPSLSEYLKSERDLSPAISNQLIEMIKEMKRLGLTRLDAVLRHIIVTKRGKLKVVDHVNSFLKIHPYPWQLLEGLAKLGYKKQFLRHVKEKDEALYDEWKKLMKKA